MRYKHLLSEQQLDEIRMSPSALRQFAQSPEAEGIQAGFEAELIFPGLGDSSNSDYEPDYDEDTRAHSIEDIINFFEYDDYGYGLSGREADRLRNDLDEQWMEYFDNAMYEEWHGEALSLIKDVIENTDWDRDEQIREYLSVEHPDLDANEIIKKAQEATSTRETPPEYLEAAEAVAQALDERAEESLANQDQYYDEALDNFRDNFTGASEEDWLRENYRYMSDVADAFGLSWPYIRYEGGEGEFNEYAADQLADSLNNAVGMRVVASSGYHSTRRSADTWIIEPDSSLEGNDSDDMPAEIVSPPMPLAQCLEMLDKFWAWAHDNGAYTNRSTGFHMGVSLPTTGGRVDFIKLALFLGDEHVLEAFGRSSNHFCEAAMKKIKNKVKQNAGGEQVSNAMTLLRNGLIELATKAMSTVAGHEKSPGFGKYTSINPKENYIEFRSAGGEDYDKDIAKLQNTLMRYARAMSIAANPAAERQEYYKKLYKLISPPTGDAAMDLFSRFASGNISKEELKKQWAEAALEKDAPETLRTGTWKVYDKSTGKALPGYQYNGYTETQALALVKQAMSPGSTPFGFKQAFDEKYELRNVSASTGRWAIIDQNTGETLEVVDSETRGPVADMASEKYAGQDYYIEPVPADTPKPKLSRRAELARRIKEPKAASDSNIDMSKEYYVLDQSTNKIVHTYDASDLSDAYYKFSSWKNTQQDSDNFKYGAIKHLSPEQRTQYTSSPKQTTQDTLEPGQHWEIYSINTGTALKRLDHTNRAAAAEEARTWIRMNNGNVEDFAIRAAGTPTQSQQPAATGPVERQPGQETSDSGVPKWEIYDRTTNNVLARFYDHNQTAAWSGAQQWLRDQNVPESDWNRYSVRPAVAQEQPVAGSTQDRQQQRAAGEFTGAWKVVNANTGEELHRFSGVGNVQADANRVGAQWARSARIDDPIEILPIMGESLKLTKNILSEFDSWLGTMKLPKGLGK